MQMEFEHKMIESISVMNTM